MDLTFDLSDYEIIREFKGNASNKIYLIQHRQTGQKVIHKRIKIYNLPCQLREIQSQKNLKHDYIIQLLSYSVQKDVLELFIEYASYGDLFEFINSLEFIKESILLRLFFKIVIAVEFIHSNGFIHRDIKPENVLIGDDFEPKLADFGSSVMQQIVRNTFCGTYEYMAPEIYYREKQSQKVDIWALGVLLFEMTHNKMPFREKTMDQVREILATGSIPFDAQISGRIRSVIQKILQFDPKRRPTAQQILCFPELKFFFDEMPDKLPFIDPAPPNVTVQMIKNLQSKQELFSEVKENHYKHLKSQKELDEGNDPVEKVKQELLLFQKNFELPAKLKLEPLKMQPRKRQLVFDNNSETYGNSSVHQKINKNEEKSTFYCEIESHEKLEQTCTFTPASPAKDFKLNRSEKVPLKREEQFVRIKSAKSGKCAHPNQLKLKISQRFTPKVRHARLQLQNSDKTSVRNLVNTIKRQKRDKAPKLKDFKWSPQWQPNKCRSRSPNPGQLSMFSFNRLSTGKTCRLNRSNNFTEDGQFDDYKFLKSAKAWAPGKKTPKVFQFNNQSKQILTKKAVRATAKKKKRNQLKPLQFKDFQSRLGGRALKAPKRAKAEATKKKGAKDFKQIKKDFLKSTFNSPFGYSTFSTRTSKKLKQRFFGLSKAAKRNEKEIELEKRSHVKNNFGEKYFSTRNISRPKAKFKMEGKGGEKSVSKMPKPKRGKGSPTRQRKFHKVGMSVEPKRRNWILGI